MHKGPLRKRISFPWGTRVKSWVLRPRMVAFPSTPSSLRSSPSTCCKQSARNQRSIRRLETGPISRCVVHQPFRRLSRSSLQVVVAAAAAAMVTAAAGASRPLGAGGWQLRGQAARGAREASWTGRLRRRSQAWLHMSLCPVVHSVAIALGTHSCVALCVVMFSVSGSDVPCVCLCGDVLCFWPHMSLCTIVCQEIPPVAFRCVVPGVCGQLGSLVVCGAV